MASEAGLALAKKLWNWEPHSDGQRDFMLNNAKVKTAVCGRRWGKSEGVGVDICLYAFEQPHTIQWVLAPTDDQTKIIMDEVSKRMNAVPGLRECIIERFAPYHSIKFKDAIGLQISTSIAARTVNLEGKGIRGRKGHRAIVDEAQLVTDATIQEAIEPILADYDGDLLKIGTPKGKGHFYQTYVRGQDADQPRYSSFQFPSCMNPYLSRAYLEDKKRTSPERVWLTEYEAQFLDDAGGVFRGVLAAIDPGRSKREEPQRGRVYYLGADLARSEDFTVISVIDDKGRQVYYRRDNQVSWERITELIVWAALEYNAKCHIDSSGVGDPIFEALRKRGLRVEGTVFNNANKEAMIDNLAIKIENGVARLMDIPEQTNELVIYAYEVTKDRNIRMNAPAGFHDDTVIANALTYWFLREKRRAGVV